MSFSAKVKEELARKEVGKVCCQLSELAALVRMDGTLQISTNRRINLNIESESAPVARKIFKLAKLRLGVPVDIAVRRKLRLKKNNSYLVRIQAHKDILAELGLVDENLQIKPGIKAALVQRQCCRKAYLRGAFLGGGSINNPEGTYHLEIITNDEIHASEICKVLNSFHLGAKVSPRKNWFVVYLKESEHIAEFLTLIGAHSALLEFENVRVLKDMRNQVNRLVNCETANLNKTVDAAVRQVESIKIIQRTLVLEKLDRPLREIAELRLLHSDTSLKELGEMLVPKVGKSGVNHRMRKIEDIARQLEERLASR
ncbi:MAG TPA: DNA-binding protein WhiA [Verrucomicrobiae bacterium]|nr:DNA-binding protein WhiA [Verrucomicrobiae bacterium]